MTDAGLALNGLTGIQPLTITIVAIIGLPRLVPPGCLVLSHSHRWPSFPFLLLLSTSRSSSFTLFASTGNHYRHRHSYFFQTPIRRAVLFFGVFKVIRGNMSKSNRAPVPFDSTAVSWTRYTFPVRQLREIGLRDLSRERYLLAREARWTCSWFPRIFSSSVLSRTVLFSHE